MVFFHPQESLENTNKYDGYTVKGTPNCPLIKLSPRMEVEESPNRGWKSKVFATVNYTTIACMGQTVYLPIHEWLIFYGINW